MTIHAPTQAATMQRTRAPTLGPMPSATAPMPPGERAVPVNDLNEQFQTAARDLQRFLDSASGKQMGEFKHLRSWLGRRLDVSA